MNRPRTGTWRAATKPPRLRVSAMILSEGRLLLVEQSKGDSRYWLLPGGGVERGETIADALVREVQEECALLVEPLLPPLGLVESISPGGGQDRHIVHLIYAARLVGGSSAAGREQGPGREGSGRREDIVRRDPAILQFRWVETEELSRLTIHPPVTDLLEVWADAFASGPPRDWPAFVHAGVRWVE